MKKDIYSQLNLLFLQTPKDFEQGLKSQGLLLKAVVFITLLLSLEKLKKTNQKRLPSYHLK